ncbi:MAG: hypothetical protein GY797_07330 [Deltaproteobacteria bacterium]|nr:hypothetical protein [Deltaproteobacteria bacterium]
MEKILELQDSIILSEFYLVIAAVGMILFSLAARFYLTHAQKFNEEYPTLSEREFHWLIWPAIGVNYIFERIFGKRAAHFELTDRSFADLSKEDILVETRSHLTERLVSEFKRSKDVRLLQEAEELQQKWDQQSQKLQELTTRKVLETHIDEELRLENLITELSKKREQVAKKLDELETKLPPDARLRSDESRHEPDKVNIAAFLKDLKGREYVNERTFLSAIEAKLGKDLADRYKPLIVEHAEKKTRVWDLYTWRSISATFLVSLLANSVCVMIILLSVPDDVPPFGLHLLKILGLSYFAFIFFNFWGDLVSISFTRHVVSRIVTGKCNFLKYIVIDGFGIFLGYVITLLPSLSITLFCWFTGAHLNQWIHTGLLGNALIPFFLFIFATTTMPPLFTVFAIIAVLSITIPTVIYLSLMVFCYVGYRIYCLVWRNKGFSDKIDGALRLLIYLGIFLLVFVAISEISRMFIQ